MRWVFRGDDGLDELTTTTTSSVWVVSGGEVESFTLHPTDLGIPAGTMEGLHGGDAAYNAQVVRDLVAGAPGPVRDAVVLNAGAALAVHARRCTAGRAGRRRRPRARAIDDGAAQATLDRWVEVHPGDRSIPRG